MVDKYQVSAGTTVDADVAKELVFTNRNYQSLITSLPGVVHSDESTQLAELMPSVNGDLWQENAAFVDGVDTTNTRYGGGSRMILPTSALAEVRSDASGYGAEYGRVVGGVTGVVTKSGTNTFHGDFQYIAQNQKWEAQSDDVPLPREDDIIDSYEASVGGPILRDKAWFFAAAADNDTNQISSLAGGDVIENSVDLGVVHRQAQLQLRRLGTQLVGTYIDAPAVVPFFVDQLRRPQRRSRSTTSAAASPPRAGAGRRRPTCSSRCAAPTRTRARAAPSSPPRRSSRALPPTIRRATRAPTGTPATRCAGTRAACRWGRACSSSRASRANVAATWFVPQNELKFGVDYQDVGWESLNIVPDRYMGAATTRACPGGFVHAGDQERLPRDRLAGRDLQHQPRRLRAGPHRGRRSLELQLRRALRGSGARERPGAGGAVLGGPHAAPRRDLRRRRRRQAAGQGDRGPLPHAHRAGVHQRRSSRPCPTAPTRSTSSAGTRRRAATTSSSAPSSRPRAPGRSTSSPTTRTR